LHDISRKQKYQSNAEAPKLTTAMRHAANDGIILKADSSDVGHTFGSDPSDVDRASGALHPKAASLPDDGIMPHGLISR
jgi:hypothetical protein